MLGDEAARLSALVSSSDDAIISKRLDGTITSWNRGAELVFGYSAQEMIGQKITRLFPPDRVNEEAAIIAQVGRGETVKHYEAIRIRKDGTPITVSVTVSPIRNRDGAIVGASKIARDVTQRLQLEAERLRLERRLIEAAKLESLGVLAGGIAHDFNNLLTGILGNASLARHELTMSSPTARLLKEIEVSARRAGELCQQLLAYAGKTNLRTQKIDVNRLVTETGHLLRISISKQCVLNFNLAEPLLPIEGDPTQIRQVLMNLIINGSDAIGNRSGYIFINTGLARIDASSQVGFHPSTIPPPGDYVFIEVSDNGSGMDRATLDKIFDPFFTTKFAGRGLGLAAVLGIVRGHRGGLKVYSEPGKGTTFKILFPVSSGKAAAETQPKADASEKVTGTVLVVDDDETVRTVAARILEGIGLQVVCAADGREAVETFQARPQEFRWVLLDLTMPHMDGAEALRRMTALNPQLCAVFMSGFSQVEVGRTLSGRKVFDFIQKPFQVETLVDVALRACRATMPPKAPTKA